MDAPGSERVPGVWTSLAQAASDMIHIPYASGRFTPERPNVLTGHATGSHTQVRTIIALTLFYVAPATSIYLVLMAQPSSRLVVAPLRLVR